ncbi:FecR family protein [Desulfobacterium sp. N47]|uniref:FecR protein domain-containing protein n=1 Tax=uncultured Desulfobacterium sp. TaxID=201089 RepID=E1YIL3_9BACT|nr:hypothetical protein N47_Q17300 [uncultured Desulfobacterium sp.]
MKKPVVFVIILLLWGLSNTSFADMQHIGKIKGTSGIVSIQRNGKMIPAFPNMKVYLNDSLITGSNGVAGILLEDNTLLSMGSMSRLALDKFDFSPANNKYALQLRMGQGTFVYLSGLMGKLAPNAVKIETPSGTISMLKETNFMARFPGDE